VLGSGAALVLAQEGAPGALVDPWWVLGVAGLAALGRSLVPQRGWWCCPGVFLLAVAWWVLLDDTSATTPELWTVPPAVLALAVGALAWQRQPSAPSWLVLGPGLVAGLVPSVWLTVTEQESTRVALTVAAAALVCVLGVWRSWQAPLVTGAVAAIVVAVGQLGPYVVGAPVWASLGAAGVLLLVLAVRIEQARQDTRRAVGWLRALH
jgi:hypothetical protein